MHYFDSKNPEAKEYYPKMQRLIALAIDDVSLGSTVADTIVKEGVTSAHN